MENQQLEIRRLKEEDLPALARLYEQFWNEESNVQEMRHKYQELKDDSRYVTLCAIVDGAVVGSATGIICDELYGECRPFLVMEDLVVDRRYRRQGIGSALVVEIEKHASEYGCSQIQFLTETSRKDALLFYRSLGYDAKTHVGFKKTLNKS